MLMLHTTPDKKNYPKVLLQLAQPPKNLFIESKNWPELAEKPMLAVVGSRKVSTYGRSVTEQLVRGVVARGIVIVSGLALGLDAIAHQTALDAGGQTIAVLPSGLEAIYPSTHHQLARNIVAQGGALISEYPPHEKIAFKGNFIARNRIVAGLCAAILIPEAAEKSGSLHTANFALEQGKDVLAVPGPITSPLSAGCNNLIKIGATPVTSLDDILAVYQLPATAGETHHVQAANAAEHAILELIASGVTDIDTLQTSSGLTPLEFQQTLSMLEITGKVSAQGGGSWTLR